MRTLETLLAFLRQGSISFGGPVAHLGYFRAEFVERRKWLDDATYAAFIAIAQLLPGPASSQVGIMIGWLRAGLPGAVAAWVGFTFPSAFLMALLALAFARSTFAMTWVHGLLVVAVAIVASAIATMRVSLAPDPLRLLFAIVVTIAVLSTPPAFAAWTAPLAIIASAVAGALLLRNAPIAIASLQGIRISRGAGIVAFGAFLALAIGLPVLAWLLPSQALVLAANLFDIGSFVFGGGHVVLPLLQTQVAAHGIVSQRQLLAGYSAAQAIPGPLFTIASYVGVSAYGGALGVAGACIGTIAIFAPSFLLVAFAFAWYGTLAQSALFRRALAGANAGVIGLLAAAFLTPVWSNAVRTPVDLVVALLAFVALHVLRTPPWIVVLAGAVLGASKIVT